LHRARFVPTTHRNRLIRISARRLPCARSQYIDGGIEIRDGAECFVIGILWEPPINVLVGALLVSSPIAAAVAVPVVFGALLLIQDVGLIILAFRVRA
jgi:hypothetical protein